ncbi:hypothetical protein FR483_n483R [Paramecium bursaria Chlorella virus FR483]|uniref:Uncharacterized protein n483R n=1 Tax=Paramecium bursaria Chlorella virus FR483 TaxID=399781 RepID=A7J7I7_PBCVF|nr:hypothetical protein FR483_n483R [Paramecium bursaria Chlorella virus FR483]ABT15768.1 hypothetical protein FR483_n483R [Paramecium bursaria Chlorella virus FR483]
MEPLCIYEVNILFRTGRLLALLHFYANKLGLGLLGNDDGFATDHDFLGRVNLLHNALVEAHTIVDTGFAEDDVLVALGGGLACGNARRATGESANCLAGGVL